MKINFKQLAGVYLIVCTKNSKMYIGSSEFAIGRCHSHLSSLKGDRHPNKDLQKDYNEFGGDFFEFRVLLKTSKYLEVESLIIASTKCDMYNVSGVSGGVMTSNGIKRRLTKEVCLEVSKKFPNRSQLKSADGSVYSKCLTNGWLDEFFPSVRKSLAEENKGLREKAEENDRLIEKLKKELLGNN